MNKRLACCVAIILLVSNTALANRQDVVNQYVDYLGKADYKNISTLFTKNGYVISTTHGKVNAKEFFYSFLPATKSIHAELKDVYRNRDKNKWAARFHLNVTMKNGENDEGEYMDEFVFAKHSDKLVMVTMFENLKGEQLHA